MRGAVGSGSETERELAEGSDEPFMEGALSRDVVMSAAQVLHERVTGGHRANRAVAFEAAHRPQSGFEPTVVCLDRIIAVLMHSVQGLRQEFLQDARVARGPIGGDLERHRAYLEHLDEERARGCEIPLDAEHYIHDLAVLVDGS